MPSLPVLDEGVHMVGQFFQPRDAPGNHEVVEVSKCADMLSDRGVARVQFIQRLRIALDLRPQPLGLDAVDRIERSEMTFQHDNHPSGKVEEMSCCARPAVMCPDPVPKRWEQAPIGLQGT